MEITVEDENEEPTCDITESELTIDVDARVGAGDVLSFSCSDPDVVPEYRQLSYSLTGSTNGMFSVEVHYCLGLLDVNVIFYTTKQKTDDCVKVNNNTNCIIRMNAGHSNEVICVLFLI